MKKVGKILSVALVFMFLLIPCQAGFAAPAPATTSLKSGDVRIEYNANSTQIQVWVNANYKMVDGLNCYLVVKGKDGTVYYVGDAYTELQFRSNPPATTRGMVLPNRYYGSWSAQNNLYLKPGQYQLGVKYTQSGRSNSIWKKAIVNGRSESSYITVGQVEVVFAKWGDQDKLTANTIATLKSIAMEAGLASLTITSTVRTPEEQARAMYDNIRSTGAARQKQLYGSAGDAVIDVYSSELKKGSSQNQILQAMSQKVYQLGPSNVSRHCLSNGRTLDVFDIASSSVSNKAALRSALSKAQQQGQISKYIDETSSNGCFHVEISRR